MGTVSTLLAEHVSFRCTSVDRIGIRGYIPGLQYEGGLVKFLVNQGNRIPSPAALNRNRERLVAELDALVEASGVPVVRFRRGESKEDIARPYQDAALAAGRAGLVLVGKAQERTSSWRGFVDKTHASHRPGHPHISWRRQSSVPDHWYLYFADDECGPAFIKLCSYARFIERIEGTNTYRVTAHGLRIAAFFTQLATRVVVPGVSDLAALARPHSPVLRPLTRAWIAYGRELNQLLRTTRLAA